MGVAEGAMAAGRVVNDVVSFVVFIVLDMLDAVLCWVYKLADYAMESDRRRPCYCSSSSPRDTVTSIGKILVSETGGRSTVVSLVSSYKMHLEDISDTLYSRASFLSEIARLVMNGLRRVSISAENGGAKTARAPAAVPSAGGGSTTSFTVNSTVVQMLREKIGSWPHTVGLKPRWSDCHCASCNPVSPATLFVHLDGPEGDAPQVEEEAVLFIHGFISSSEFWTETVFPNLSKDAKRRYRLFAVDLLGFGRSPKPSDSLYTLREHVEMIERSVLEAYKVRSFHIVAHSLGSIIALALAVKHPGAVKSLTLIAPPYFRVPEGEKPTQYVLRRVAPRKVWPMIALGSSVACWYEHLGRTVCLVMCKNHRLWEMAFRLVTFNRVRTYLMDGFFCHTHIASWHTLHNVICGTAGKIEKYLDIVRDQLGCTVTIYHGRDDELLPLHCSYAVKCKIPRAHVKIVDRKDHVTIVVGRQKEFARELEEIWRGTKC